MEEIQSITQADVDSGANFFVIMHDGSDGWITKDRIILPGRINPTKSCLKINHCAKDEKLSFTYERQGEVNIVRTGRRVREIFQM